MVSRFLLALVCLPLSLSAQAQLYKWVAADGSVTYSDTPPPKTATKVETKSYSSSNEGVALPFELAKAINNMPVTIYTAPDCIPCDDGKAFLKKNGVPFSEKTVTTKEDGIKLKKITGESQLPILIIGRSTQLKGLNTSEWRANLSQAGYPESNLLPANYQFSLPQAAAPIAKPVTNSVIQAPQQPEKPVHDPNGFQF